jgi:NADH dehydrogenase/NADH:ubiquinone oxidoreductase subunit G
VYAFQARPWELNTCESVDLSDSLISDVYLNYRDSEIYRILPKTSVQINKSIISDKARFSFDFNRNSRMNYIYQNVDKTLLLKNWEELVNIIPTFELSNNMPSLIFYVNQELDLMNLNYLNNLSFLTSGKIKVRNLYYYKDSSNFYNASLLDSVNCLNEKKDIIVFFSSNIKLECAVLNALIKLKSTFNLGSIYSLGLNYKSNLPINFINLNFSNCFLIFESKNAILSKKIISSFNFLIIFGNSFFKLIFSSNNLFKIIKKKIINSNILNISQFCNTQGSKYLNILSSNTKLIKKKNLIFGVNLDDIFNTRKYFNNFKNNFFWLNTHVSDICFKSSAIIPILTSFEQEEIHLNLENRSKKTENLLLSPFDARSLQQIITSLFKKNIIIKKNLFFDHILESANNSELFEFNHSLLGKDFMLNDISSVEIELITNYPLKSQIEDFYRSNKNTKNSLVMISCSREKRKNIFNF